MSSKIERSEPKQRRPVGRPPGDVQAQRDAVFEAALDLFSTRSYAGVPVTRLIAASGLSAGTFYRLFGDKRAVLEQLLEAVNERNRLEIELRLTDDPDPVERLRDRVEVCVEVSRAVPELPRLKRILANALPEDLADWPERVDRKTRWEVGRLLSEIEEAGRLRPGISIPDAARIVAKIIDGAVLDGMPSGACCADFVLRAVAKEER